MFGLRREPADREVTMTEATTLEPSQEEASVPDFTPLPGVLCDSECIAQAWVRVLMPGGGELHFCGHDFAKHEVKLREVALLIQDKRELINTKPSPSANV
jgi:hypothetical protein